MKRKSLHSRSKQLKLRVTRGRIRRSITAEAVPARSSPADSVVRLHAAAVPFVAHSIRRLIEQGVCVIDERGNIAVAKEHKE